MGTNHKNPQSLLNRILPVADDVKLGDMLQEMLTAYNDLATQYTLLLAKLDADLGVTDVDFASTLPAADADLKDINERS